MRARWRTWCLAIAAVPIGASLLAPPDWITTYYTRGIFAGWQRFLVPLTGAVPIPLTGLLLAAAAVLTGIVAVRRWRRGRREERRAGMMLVRGAGRVVLAAILVYAVFLCTWGLGYRQVPVEERWGFATVALEGRDAQRMAIEVAAILREPPRDRDADRAVEAIRLAIADLVAEQDGWRPAVPQHLKLLPSGTLLAFNVSGIASPFLLEANVDAGLDEIDRLGVGAHELAHTVGFCGEADADLLGLTAGLRAGDAYARYAAAVRVLKLLFRYLQPIERQELLATLPSVAIEDLAAQSLAAGRYRSETLTRASDVVYDGYLRTQGVRIGKADYGRAAELLIRAWRAGLCTLR